MISIWYQHLNQSADSPDKNDMYRLREFEDEQRAFIWQSRNSEHVKIKRITTENLHFAVRVATRNIMGGSIIQNHENKGEEKIT